MDIKHISAGSHQISEIISKEILIKDVQDALDIIGNAGSDYIILYDYNFEDDFFDLSTGKLGEILQKFSNYYKKLAIIGDFNKYPSNTLKDFIYESNKQGNYLFLSSMDEVIKRWKN